MREWCRKHKWEIGIYLLFLAVYGILIPGKRAPIIYPDEAGYIGWARLLAGQGGDGQIYFPGYGLLLAPLAVIFRDIETLYPAILILNGLLCSFLPVGIYRLADLVTEKKGLKALLAVAAGLYPTYLMYANLAMCENLLCVGFVYYVLSVRSMVRHGKCGGVLFWSVVLPLTHTRAFVLLPALGILVFLQTKGKKRWILLGAAAAVFAAGMGYLLLNQSSVNTAHLRGQLMHLFTGQGLFSLITVWISQQLYLIMATFGFYLFGIWYGIRQVIHRSKDWQTVLFILLSVLFAGGMSALYLSHHERPIHLFYGRYNDYVISCILLLGMGGWYHKKAPVWLGTVWVAFTGVTWLLYRAPLSRIGVSINNAISVFLYRIVLREFDIMLASLFFLLLAAGILLLGKRRREISLMLLCGIYLFTAVLIDQTHFEKNDRYGEPDHVAVIEAYDSHAQVQIEGDPYLIWIYNASALYAPEITLSQEQQGQHFLLSKTWDPDRPLLSSDRRMDMYLYATDDQTAQWYEERGMLLSCQQEFSGEILVVSADQDTVTLRLTNTGDPWLCLSSIRDASKAVRIGVRVLDDQNRVTDVLRYDLPCNVTKGQQTEVTLPLHQRMYVELVRDFSDTEFQGGALMLQNGREEFSQRLPKLGELWFSMLTFYEEGGSAAQQLKGFYHQYAGPEAVIQNIRLNTTNASRLRIETEQPAQFRLWADGQELELLGSAGNYTDFALTGQTEIKEFRLESECVNPFRESGLPKWLSFISIDSRILPAAWLAHRVPQWNNHDYGPAIRRIIAVQ